MNLPSEEQRACPELQLLSTDARVPDMLEQSKQEDKGDEVREQCMELGRILTGHTETLLFIWGRQEVIRSKMI